MSENITDPGPPERARIEPPAPHKRLDALPLAYLAGFVILAAALIFMWWNPSTPRGAKQEAQRVTTLREDVDASKQQLEAATARIAELEKRPAAAPANLQPLESRVAALEARQPANLKPLEDKVAALEQRQPADLQPLESQVAALEARKPVDLKPLEDRIAALEARKPVDLGPLQSALDALGKKEAQDFAQLSDKLDAESKQAAALGPRLDQMAQQAKQAAADLATVTDRAQRLARVQAAGIALESGQKLGEMPNAPPALARFAHEAPPTEASLRLSFDAAAQAAHRASQPALTDNQPFLDRMWTRAQQAVTVRQGDHVIVGDPIAGVLTRARERLDAGDLAGAVKALDGLAGPARAAMADWIDRAQSLLNARAALAQMAQG